MGLLAAAVLAAGNTAWAQDPPEPTTYQITRGSADSELTTSLNQVWSGGGLIKGAVNAGDTIEFGAGVYEDIGRRDGFYLELDKANLTVRGARDPRLGEADGACDPTADTILTGSSGFFLRSANVTVEHFCFQNIDDGSTAAANPHRLAPIAAEDSANLATVRRNRIDTTIGSGVNGLISVGGLDNLSIVENEFIDIGLIATNGAGTAIQPRAGHGAPSAIDLGNPRVKESLRIVDNLFEGSARFGAELISVEGGVISGNTFRNMAKSAVVLDNSPDITLDDNTYEGNNHAAWRAVGTANWLNNFLYGLTSLRLSDKRATMKSAALQTFMLMTKVQAVAAGMDGDQYDAAAANTVYRDPHLHAAVLVTRSPNVAISNSTFTNNHNSIAICGHTLCRVEGLEAVGDDGDTGRSPAYIALFTSPGGHIKRIQTTVTLSGNAFTDSDTRSFDGPGTVGNHVVIGYHRGNWANPSLGPAAGTITYGDGNSFTGSGRFGGAASEPNALRITRGDSDADLTTSLNTVFDSEGATLDDVEAGDTIEFGPGLYEDIGRGSGGFYLLLDKDNLTVRGARDPRLSGADGECNPTTDTILTGKSGFELRASGITVEHFCFQNIDDGSLAHANPHNLVPLRAKSGANGATLHRNRIDNTIGMGVDGSSASGITITENEFIDIGLIATNGAGTAIQPRHGNTAPSAIRLNTFHTSSSVRIAGNLFDGSAWVALSLNGINGGTISRNTFRNMDKSAVSLVYAPDITLDNNTYEGNNRAAWRVVRTANWMNNLTFGLSGDSAGTTASSKTASMESEALQDFLRLTKAQAATVGMTGALYDAATANTVYHDPGLHAAVRVIASSGIVISNSTFTDNHNSVAICGETVCRVEGLEAVGDDGDTGRAPAYISPSTYPGGASRTASAVTLRGNEFNKSDTRSFDGPGAIGNHVVIGYHRAAATTNAVGAAAGSVTYGSGNIFSGSGVFGGAALSPFTTYRITRGKTDDELKTSLDQVWASNGSMVAGVEAGDIIEFGPGEYEDIGRDDGYLSLGAEPRRARRARPAARGGRRRLRPDQGHHPDRVQRLLAPRSEYQAREFLLPEHRRRQPGSCESAEPRPHPGPADCQRRHGPPQPHRHHYRHGCERPH